jgi:hypothetical protein
MPRPFSPKNLAFNNSGAQMISLKIQQNHGMLPTI